MKIKTTKELTFPELVVLYNNGELPYGEYIHENSDTKYSVSFDSLSIKVYEKDKVERYGVKVTSTIPNHIKFKVTTEKEITEDMVFDEFVCLVKNKNKDVYTYRISYRTINDCIDIYSRFTYKDLLSISIIQDNEFITVWKDGELIK